MAPTPPLADEGPFFQIRGWRLTKCLFKYTFRYMEYITTTELRTKTKELVAALREGRSVNLIHRSKVVGQIKPDIYEPKHFNTQKFKQTIEKLNFPHLTARQIDARYRAAMAKKHGKSIS
jgi:hypothetical protein